MVNVSTYESNIKNQIQTALETNEFYKKIVEKQQQPQENQKKIDFQITEECLLIYKNITYVLNREYLMWVIMQYFHPKPCSRNPNYYKMVTIIRK